MVDVTDATFETAVMERSMAVPVVVDLWAPWCGPCRTLGPLIEKVIAETDGKVELVKINVDENPGVSQAFKVQGIPAVFAIKDGEPVDNFVGAKGEDFLREFVAKLLPTEEISQVDMLLDAGDEESLRQALELEPEEPRVVAALAEIWVGDDKIEDALALLATVPESAETRRVSALARTGGVGAPDDIEAKFAALLPKVKNDDEARKEYIDLLDVLGPDDERTADYRQQLTSALF